MSDHKKRPTLLTWNSGVNLSNTPDTPNYLRNGSMVTEINENSTKSVMMKSGKISKLTVTLVPSNGNGDVSPSPGIRSFIVRKNGQNTGLSVTLSGNATSGQDDTHEINVHKYDTISLMHNASGNPGQNALGIASAELRY